MEVSTDFAGIILVATCWGIAKLSTLIVDFLE